MLGVAGVGGLEVEVEGGLGVAELGAVEAHEFAGSPSNLEHYFDKCIPIIEEMNTTKNTG